MEADEEFKQPVVKEVIVELQSVKLHDSMTKDLNYLKAIQVFTAWINKTLIPLKISIKDIYSDLADGQILIAFIVQLVKNQGISPNKPKVPLNASSHSNLMTLSPLVLEEFADSPDAFTSSLYTSLLTLDYTAALTQKQKHQLFNRLAVMLDTSLHITQSEQTWSVEAVKRGDPCAILFLLYCVAGLWGRRIALPTNLNCVVVRVERIGFAVRSKVVLVKVYEGWIQSLEEETEDEGIYISQCHINQLEIVMNDELDNVLLDSASSAEMERILIDSIDEELRGVCDRIEDLVDDMHNGVRLIYLVSSLNDFFVPLSRYHSGPENDEEKTRNLELALKLMSDQGISLAGIQPLHVLTKDKKKIIRIL